MLNVGDKIVRMQWEGMHPVDVSDADITEIHRMLESSNHNKLTLTVKKADGTEREVTMMKELDESDDKEDKVKSFLLKGVKTVGYISLPAFYEDWENENAANGCANDVAKEIMKLKKENIDGLIIDLRYNGGGSLQEATDLAGIFIDAGPVAQVGGSKAEKIYSLKDVNRGTIYDVPLMLLINGYSASASEMVAGTLQDYHRAIIAGTPSYGKATGQIVLPMDTTIALDEKGINKTAASYIKITTGRLYRINGTTAQAKGVIPDILIPDLVQADPQHEGDEPFVLKTENIEPNKYYKPYPAPDIAALKTIADKEIAGDTWFKVLSSYIAAYKKSMQPKDISLRLSDAVKENELNAPEEPDDDEEETDPGYKVSNNAYEDLRIQASEDSKEINEKVIRYLQYDPCLRVAYHILAAM